MHKSMYGLDRFKKVYNMAPHLRVLKCLKIFEITPNVIDLVNSSMSDLKTNDNI